MEEVVARFRFGFSCELIWGKCQRTFNEWLDKCIDDFDAGEESLPWDEWVKWPFSC